MKDPVTSPYGHTYERKVVLKWIRKNGKVCPFTGKSLEASDLKANALLQWEILYWKRKNNEDSLDSSSRHSSSEFSLPQDRKLDLPPSMPSPSSEFTLHQDKTDSPPSVPRRKNSDTDLPSLEVSSTKSAPELTARSMLLNDMFRSLTCSSSDSELQFEQEESRSMQTSDILSVLDEVESALQDSAF